MKIIAGAMTIASAIAVVVPTYSMAVAQTPPVSWQGSMTLVGLNGTACTKIEGLGVGAVAISIYRPKLRTGDQPSSVSFVWNRAAAIYQKSTSTGQLNGAGNYNGTQIVTRAGLFSFNGAYNFVTTPAVVTATTVDVTMTGTLTNFQRRVGCTATIRASFTKRPAGEN